jgi:ribosome-binding protein aMBF1 (putative translation factor)
MRTKARLVSEQLRKAIEGAGVSRYQLSKETGISESVLSRFVAGKTSLTIDNADKLCERLQLQLVKQKER